MSVNGDLRLINQFEQDYRAHPVVAEMARRSWDIHQRLTTALDAFTDAVREARRLGHDVPIPTLRGGLGPALGAD